MKQFFTYLLGILAISLLSLDAVADNFEYYLVVGSKEYSMGTNNNQTDTKYGKKELTGTELAASGSTGQVGVYVRVKYNPENSNYYLRPSATTTYSNYGTTVNLSNNYSNSNNVVMVDFSAHQTGDDYYTFEMQASSSSAGTIKVTYENRKVSDYYLVSPELTNNQKLESFRLAPSRVREGGPLSYNLYTLNLKDERVAALLAEYNKTHGATTDIHYYIVKGDDGTQFRPNTADYKLGASGSLSTTNNNVRTEYYAATNVVASGSNMFALTPGSGVSYTWMFDASGDNCLTQATNLKGLVENAQKKYYAVGNYSDASAAVNLQPGSSEGRRLMTRLVYTNGTGVGVPSNDTPANLDSVVYRVAIPRPAKGWGELYMVMADADVIDGFNGGSDWDYMIRPQVQNYGSAGSKGMDGTALEGGVFWGNNAATNKSQALNPQLTSVYANATSYTFSVNITTSTYRISFNDETMWLTGPGVKGSDKNATAQRKTVHVNTGTVDAPATEDQQWNAIPLTWNDEEQCFQNIVSEQEAAVHFETGGRFRFVYGMDFSNTWFGENGNAEAGNSADNPNVPASLVNGTMPYTAYGEGYDTEYVNYLNAYQSATNVASDKSKSLFFNLPQKSDGTGYVIRLYLRTIGDRVRYFYTINRKISFHDAKAGVTALNGDRYFRSFSEWHACKIPDGVDHVYIVTERPAHHAKVDIQEGVTMTDISSLGYIPARTGVILGARTMDTSRKLVFETYAANPEAELPATYTNYLKPAIYDQPIYVEKDDVTYNNFVFDFEGDDGTKVGFYYPLVDLKSGRNNCFLQLDRPTAANPAKAMAGRMAFYIGEAVTNGIERTETETVDTDGAPYYTLQGVRVDRPASRGIYIHNGRKVIIK